MQNKNSAFLIRFAAISGNILFILWVTYNGINEGFRGTLPEKISYIGMMCLLILNSYLIVTGSKQKQIIEQ
ncbi:hypothetical protein [Mucilaginibacter sp. OK098]|uniref:hypothetical protein n=1 Tax=Mucilaginibacter sp. OK098 TaxID=1855297 RepID=UPI00091CA573|nr:hypothetical protein [Mucilaginibacter sp. OK098]SHN02557.1 hypothetical protein SAMN05216524_104643 [Mucilaginibacter sp. OK098]